MIYSSANAEKNTLDYMWMWILHLWIKIHFQIVALFESKTITITDLPIKSNNKALNIFINYGKL